MGFSDSMTKVLVGHRKLIGLQQKEIDSLKRELRDLRKTTARLVAQNTAPEQCFEEDLANIQQELKALRKASVASDTLQTLETEVARLRDDNDQIRRRQRRDIEALRNEFRNFEQMQSDLQANGPRPANDPHHELREIRQSIQNLKAQKASAAEVSSLASSVERLKKAGGIAASPKHRYNRTWISLLIFNLIVIIAGVVGLDRAWRSLQQIAPVLPSAPIGVIAIVLLSGMLALNLTATSAWRLLSWKDKHRMSFFRQISGARMMSLGAVFISALAWLARASIT